MLRLARLCAYDPWLRVDVRAREALDNQPSGNPNPSRRLSGGLEGARLALCYRVILMKLSGSLHVRQ